MSWLKTKRKFVSLRKRKYILNDGFKFCVPFVHSWYILIIVVHVFTWWVLMKGSMSTNRWSNILHIPSNIQMIYRIHQKCRLKIFKNWNVVCRKILTSRKASNQVRLSNKCNNDRDYMGIASSQIRFKPRILPLSKGTPAVASREFVESKFAAFWIGLKSTTIPIISDSTSV